MSDIGNIHDRCWCPVAGHRWGSVVRNLSEGLPLRFLDRWWSLWEPYLSGILYLVLRRLNVWSGTHRHILCDSSLRVNKHWMLPIRTWLDLIDHRILHLFLLYRHVLLWLLSRIHIWLRDLIAITFRVDLPRHIQERLLLRSLVVLKFGVTSEVQPLQIDVGVVMVFRGRDELLVFNDLFGRFVLTAWTNLECTLHVIWHQWGSRNLIQFFWWPT